MLKRTLHLCCGTLHLIPPVSYNQEESSVFEEVSEFDWVSLVKGPYCADQVQMGIPELHSAVNGE